MLTIAVNVLAFFLGAVFFRDSHFLVGMVVFIVTALGGTIVSTMIEVHMKSLFRLARPVRIRTARTTITPAPKPSPSAADSN